MLLDQIQSDLVTAQKGKDQRRVDTLRFLLGELHNLEIAKYPPGSGGKLTEEDVLATLSRQVKNHRESIESFEKGGRLDLVEKEKAELVILQTYLPAQMGEEEIRKIVEDLKSANPGADFAALIKLAMAELKGKAEGGAVAKITRDALQEDGEGRVEPAR